MRKTVKTLLVLQLPIVVWLLVGVAHSNAINKPSANDKAPVGKQFFAPPSNQIAVYATTQKPNRNVRSVLTQTRGNNVLGWWAYPQTIEQLLVVRSVKYLSVVVNIFRCGSTEIIFPFHSFG